MATAQDIINDPAKLDEVVSLVFGEFDADGSGEISKDELAGAVNSFNKQAGVDAASDDQINEAFGALDVNNDGKISKDEFKTLVVAILNSM